MRENTYNISFWLKDKFTYKVDCQEYRFCTGDIYRGRDFSNSLVHLDYVVNGERTRSISAVLIPCYDHVLYAVGDDGFIHCFGNLYGFRKFVMSREPMYQAAKQRFVQEILDRTFWPYNMEILNEVEAQLKEIIGGIKHD